MKKSVIKFIPVFSVNDETILHCEQRIGVVVFCAPQVKYFVPMIKNIILLNSWFQVFQTFYKLKIADVISNNRQIIFERGRRDQSVRKQ